MGYWRNDVRLPKGTLVVFICNHCPYANLSSAGPQLLTQVDQAQAAGPPLPREVESKLCICRETARTSHRTDAEQSLHVVSCVLAPIPGCAFEPNRFENVEPDRFRTLYQIAHSERRWMLDKVDNTARPGPADSKQFREAHLPVPLGGRISGHLREAHQGGAAGSA
jgi:hypothetical protein